MSDAATTAPRREESVGEADSEQARRVLRGDDPSDEATMMDDEEPPALAEHPLASHPTAQPPSK